MKIFKWRKKQPEQKTKQYTFTVLEAIKTGDMYSYKVKADSKKEAFIKLVKYFYGEGFIDKDIESESEIVSFPHADTFQTNMPYWFARLISGNRRAFGKDCRKELQKFAIDNNINLKKDEWIS